jgi:hypothetical protein
MTNEKSSHKGNVLILMAMFGLMVVMSPRPARAQQDVDPTWYNPWAPATPVVAHVVSHANATKTSAEANHGQKTLTAAPPTKAKAQLTSTPTQKAAKLQKTTLRADQS